MKTVDNKTPRLKRGASHFYTDVRLSLLQKADNLVYLLLDSGQLFLIGRLSAANALSSRGSLCGITFGAGRLAATALTLIASPKRRVRFTALFADASWNQTHFLVAAFTNFYVHRFTLVLFNPCIIHETPLT